MTRTEEWRMCHQDDPPSYDEVIGSQTHTVHVNLVLSGRTDPQPRINQRDPGQSLVAIDTNERAICGSSPVLTTCHECLLTVQTVPESAPKDEAYLFCCFLCFISGGLLFWLPFVAESMYVTTHRCPSCNAVVGVCNS